MQTDRTSAFMVDPVKIFLTSSLTTMQNLVDVSQHSVHTHRRPQKFWKHCDLALGMGTWL